ncbi:MAG: glucoamylase family protein, partial [Chitinophagaceae bacterium]
FNPTFPEKGTNPNGWVSPYKFGLNQAPIVIMIENHTTGLIWDLMKKCPYIIGGLKKAGFKNGWLKNKSDMQF